MQNICSSFRLTSVLCVLALSLLAPVAGYAQNAASRDPAPAAAASQAQQDPAGKFVQNLGNQGISIMADGSLRPDQRTAKYRSILHDAFDLPAIGHFVVGRAWNNATPEQQQEYMKLFADLVVRMYGNNLNFYSGETFRVSGVRSENANDSIVTSVVDRPGAANPITIDWRVRKEGDKFAVIDVMIDGVSQSVTQHQEYASIIQRDGGKIDGLLSQMRQQAQSTSTSAPKED